MAQRLIARLKWKIKHTVRKNCLRNTMTMVDGFDNENLFKGVLKFDKHFIKLYYYQKIIDHIKAGHFDMILLTERILRCLKKPNNTNEILLNKLFRDNNRHVCNK